jgi:hypothetical protein
MALTVFSLLSQHAFAQDPEHEPERVSPDVVAVAHDDRVEVGLPIGPAREGVAPLAGRTRLSGGGSES